MVNKYGIEWRHCHIIGRLDSKADTGQTLAVLCWTAGLVLCHWVDILLSLSYFIQKQLRLWHLSYFS